VNFQNVYQCNMVIMGMMHMSIADARLKTQL